MGASSMGSIHWVDQWMEQPGVIVHQLGSSHHYLSSLPCCCTHSVGTHFLGCIWHQGGICRYHHLYQHCGFQMGLTTLWCDLCARILPVYCCLHQYSCHSYCVCIRALGFPKFWQRTHNQYDRLPWERILEIPDWNNHMKLGMSTFVGTIVWAFGGFDSLGTMCVCFGSLFE